MIAKNTCTVPQMNRSGGVSSRCTGSLLITRVRGSPATMNSTPSDPMSSAPMPVHATMARRAMRALPAPRYWPASAPAAVPIAKPGRKLNDSQRIAIRWAPCSPSLGTPSTASAIATMPMTNSTSRFADHMPRLSRKPGSPTRTIRPTI